MTALDLSCTSHLYYTKYPHKDIIVIVDATLCLCFYSFYIPLVIYIVEPVRIN